MANEKLTKRQAQILELIRDQTEKNGYPPSVREIGEALGLSSSATVHAHLAALENKGYLHREGTKSRSLTLSERSEGDLPTPLSTTSRRDKVISLPLVGQVAAGQPILAEQNIEEQIPLPEVVVGDSASFVLKVQGDSMVDIGIMDGDYVVVREQDCAENGQVVVALIDDSATVKTFYQEKDRVRLQPENSHMAPLYFDDVVILGRVVALFRSF